MLKFFFIQDFCDTIIHSYFPFTPTLVVHVHPYILVSLSLINWQKQITNITIVVAGCIQLLRYCHLWTPVNLLITKY